MSDQNIETNVKGAFVVQANGRRNKTTETVKESERWGNSNTPFHLSYFLLFENKAQALR